MKPLSRTPVRGQAVLLALLCAAELAAFGADEPAWDFEKFHQAFPDPGGVLRTSQSGKAGLEPALAFCRESEKPARNNRELRKRLLAAWRELLGPGARNRGPLAVAVLETRDEPEFVRRKIEYTGDPGERIRAWVFIPKGTRGRMPAMLCLHQTARSGKDQCAGVDEFKPELAFGPELAKRGFVTLCPDAISFGERFSGGAFFCHYGDAAQLYRNTPGRGVLSKMTDDAQRAVDVLEAMPEVDRRRIGCIGHSHGGYGTLCAMAFDQRIKAGVVSCGFSCFRPDPRPERWFRRTALIPRLSRFEGQVENIPVDFHHLFAALAPRPLFISAALQDRIFPNFGDPEWLARDTKAVYARENAADAFELFAFPGGHAFTPEATARAWAFLDKHLKP